MCCQLSVIVHGLLDLVQLYAFTGNHLTVIETRLPV